jgi:hypothetical protein
MAQYIVNTQTGDRNEHEVHVVTCAHKPEPRHQRALGEHTSCHTAVAQAKVTYPTADGCGYCCRPCHRL